MAVIRPQHSHQDDHDHGVCLDNDALARRPHNRFRSLRHHQDVFDVVHDGRFVGTLSGCHVGLGGCF